MANPTARRTVFVWNGAVRRTSTLWAAALLRLQSLCEWVIGAIVPTFGTDREHHLDLGSLVRGTFQGLCFRAK
jgi:hypothetical protein